MAPCRIQIEEHRDIAIIKLSGSLTNADVESVLNACKQALGKEFHKIIMDVLDLAHVDLDGLSAIISSYIHSTNAEARFVLWNPQEDLSGHLVKTKLDTIIPKVSGELSAALAMVNDTK